MILLLHLKERIFFLRFAKDYVQVQIVVMNNHRVILRNTGSLLLEKNNELKPYEPLHGKSNNLHR